MGLSKKSERLRDNLIRKQLTALSFAKALANDKIKLNDLQGNNPCRQACSEAAYKFVLAGQYFTSLVAKRAYLD